MGESLKIRAAVVTTSDSRSLADDVSGARLKELLVGIEAEVVEHMLVSDNFNDIKESLEGLIERNDVNLILTSGGTGLGPRDNTPEATTAVVDREVPGIPEAMRLETAAITKFAMLSRGVAGIRNGTLIINLPGSPTGVEECFAVIAPILRHAVQIAAGETSH